MHENDEPRFRGVRTEYSEELVNSFGRVLIYSSSGGQAALSPHGILLWTSQRHSDPCATLPRLINDVAEAVNRHETCEQSSAIGFYTGSISDRSFAQSVTRHSYLDAVIICASDEKTCADILALVSEIEIPGLVPVDTHLALVHTVRRLLVLDGVLFRNTLVLPNPMGETWFDRELITTVPIAFPLDEPEADCMEFSCSKEEFLECLVKLVAGERLYDVEEAEASWARICEEASAILRAKWSSKHCKTRRNSARVRGGRGRSIKDKQKHVSSIEKVFVPFQDENEETMSLGWLYESCNALDQYKLEEIQPEEVQLDLTNNFYQYSGNLTWGHGKWLEEPPEHLALNVDEIPIFIAYDNAGEQCFIVGARDTLEAEWSWSWEHLAFEEEAEYRQFEEEIHPVSQISASRVPHTLVKRMQLVTDAWIGSQTSQNVMRVLQVTVLERNRTRQNQQRAP